MYSGSGSPRTSTRLRRASARSGPSIKTQASFVSLRSQATLGSMTTEGSMSTDSIRAFQQALNNTSDPQAFRAVMQDTEVESPVPAPKPPEMAHPMPLKSQLTRGTSLIRRASITARKPRRSSNSSSYAEPTPRASVTSTSSPSTLVARRRSSTASYMNTGGRRRSSVTTTATTTTSSSSRTARRKTHAPRASKVSNPSITPQLYDASQLKVAQAVLEGSVSALVELKNALPAFTFALEDNNGIKKLLLDQELPLSVTMKLALVHSGLQRGVLSVAKPLSRAVHLLDSPDLSLGAIVSAYEANSSELADARKDLQELISWREVTVAAAKYRAESRVPNLWAKLTSGLIYREAHRRRVKAAKKYIKVLKKVLLKTQNQAVQARAIARARGAHWTELHGNATSSAGGHDMTSVSTDGHHLPISPNNPESDSLSTTPRPIIGFPDDLEFPDDQPPSTWYPSGEATQHGSRLPNHVPLAPFAFDESSDAASTSDRRTLWSRRTDSSRSLVSGSTEWSARSGMTLPKSAQGFPPGSLSAPSFEGLESDPGVAGDPDLASTTRAAPSSRTSDAPSSVITPHDVETLQVSMAAYMKRVVERYEAKLAQKEVEIRALKAIAEPLSSPSAKRSSLASTMPLDRSPRAPSSSKNQVDLSGPQHRSSSPTVHSVSSPASPGPVLELSSASAPSTPKGTRFAASRHGNVLRSNGGLTKTRPQSTPPSPRVPDQSHKPRAATSIHSVVAESSSSSSSRISEPSKPGARDVANSSALEILSVSSESQPVLQLAVPQPEPPVKHSVELSDYPDNMPFGLQHTLEMSLANNLQSQPGPRPTPEVLEADAGSAPVQALLLEYQDASVASEEPATANDTRSGSPSTPLVKKVQMSIKPPTAVGLRARGFQARGGKKPGQAGRSKPTPGSEANQNSATGVLARMDSLIRTSSAMWRAKAAEMKDKEAQGLEGNLAVMKRLRPSDPASPRRAVMRPNPGESPRLKQPELMVVDDRPDLTSSNGVTRLPASFLPAYAEERPRLFANNSLQGSNSPRGPTDSDETDAEVARVLNAVASRANGRRDAPGPDMALDWALAADGSEA